MYVNQLSKMTLRKEKIHTSEVWLPQHNSIGNFVSLCDAEDMS